MTLTLIQNWLVSIKKFLDKVFERKHNIFTCHCQGCKLYRFEHKINLSEDM